MVEWLTRCSFWILMGFLTRAWGCSICCWCHSEPCDSQSKSGLQARFLLFFLPSNMFINHDCPCVDLCKRCCLICSPSEALSAAFIDTDTAFRHALDLQRPRKKAHAKNWHPGCTATAILLVNNLLFVANAGDCRTVLCRNGLALPLSKVLPLFCLTLPSLASPCHEAKPPYRFWLAGSYS